MRFKTGILIGLGAGYVLGAKAGRERYQQIVEATRAFMDNPGVQRLTDEVNKTVNVGKERISNAAGRRVDQASSVLAEQASKARSYVSGGETNADKSASTTPSTTTTTPSTPSTSSSSKTGQKAEESAGAPPATTTTSTTSSSGTRSGRSG